MGDERTTIASIGIDGFNLALPQGTGVATYGMALAQAVRSLGMPLHGLFGVPVGRDPRLHEILFYEAMGRGMPSRRAPRWLRPVLDRVSVARGLRVAEVEESGRIERDGFVDRLPRFDRLLSSARLFEQAEHHFRRTRRFLELELPEPPTIMHWTYPIPIRVAGARNIYTLHDLVPLKLPFATLDRKRFYHRLVERCVVEGDHIVTVSEASRRDIIELLGAPEAGVTNTYQHTPMPAALADEMVDVEAVFGVKSDGFFLFFGAIEPKKNVARLAEAFLSTDTQHPLVLVGGRGWQKDEELRLVEAAQRRSGAAGPRIIQLDYLPRRLVMQLVRAARAVLFPSLYEGFGLPVLEAMQLGTPVITSNRASLPEVAGDAALIVDPYDVSALSAAIARIDRDADLRSKMRQAGLAQAARFSLGEHRRRLHALYSGVLAAPPR